MVHAQIKLSAADPESCASRAVSGVSIPDSPIFSAADTARLMGFPSRAALAKARRTGRLSISMFQLPGRRGWFASRQEVLGWLHRCLNTKETAL